MRGIKNDYDKPDPYLVVRDMSRAIEAVAKVASYGKLHYSEGGWQHVDNAYHRYSAALLRHMLAESDDAVDSESGLYHAAHLAWNALARLELMLREVEAQNDDD